MKKIKKIKTVSPKKRVVKKQKYTHTTKVEHCVFNGIVWDQSSMEVISMVARGLVNLTELFKSQNVTIGPMLSISNKDEPEK